MVLQMITTRFKVILKIYLSSIPLVESNWSRALSSIYHSPGPNFDGYISSVAVNNDTLVIDCYTVEGPEEYERINGLKAIYRNWSLHRKSAVSNAILCFATSLGIRIRRYQTDEISAF
jgi:hypothetical protein